MKRHDPIFMDLILDSTLSLYDIAEHLGTSEQEIRKTIKELGLEWVSHKRGHASRGQYMLYSIMRKLFPGERIVTEEPIGERLRLDVYCPKYNLAAEYHGIQHYQYVEFFHEDIEGFKDAQRRDERKIEICKDLGITLVVFRSCDTLNEDIVCERIVEAIRTSNPISKPEKKKPEYYQAYLARQREYRREAYRKMKRQKRLMY